MADLDELWQGEHPERWGSEALATRTALAHSKWRMAYCDANGKCLWPAGASGRFSDTLTAAKEGERSRYLLMREFLANPIYPPANPDLQPLQQYDQPAVQLDEPAADAQAAPSQPLPMPRPQARRAAPRARAAARRQLPQSDAPAASGTAARLQQRAPAVRSAPAAAHVDVAPEAAGPVRRSSRQQAQADAAAQAAPGASDFVYYDDEGGSSASEHEVEGVSDDEAASGYSSDYSAGD